MICCADILSSFSNSRRFGLLTVALLSLLVGSCATADRGGDYNVSGYKDPFEQTNRAIFKFNDTLDQAIGKPVAEAYDKVVPSPVKKGISNVLKNLKGPISVVNQLLQGDVEGFANDTVRFLVNSTFGLAGVLDIATEAGLDDEPEDFGQTLAVWGVDDGPYVVLPILGPASLRDQFGMAVDSIADPVRLYAFNKDEEMFYYGRSVMSALDKRVELLDTLEDLRENSLDYYAAFRSAQYQNRQSYIRDASKNSEFNFVEIPDYEDYDF